MTATERRALAAALRHGRTRYAFRAWYLGAYAWYPKPFTGRDAPVLTATNMGAGRWVLEFALARVAVDSVLRALLVLEFFGVYQPAMAEVA